MACCCGPQVCLCSTPANGAKATQVLAEFSNFTCFNGASSVRAVWRDFANITITNYLNDLSVYCSVLDPQPVWTPAGAVVYGFSATYSPGYCENSELSMDLVFNCNDGSGRLGGSLGFSFRRDAEPQKNQQGTEFISRCGWCGSAFTPDTCNGSSTFGSVLPAPAGNVCTMQSGTVSQMSLQYVVGTGNDFDLASYTGDITYTPL